MDDLSRWYADWPVTQVAAGVTDPETTRVTGGDVHWRVSIASVSKLLTGLAALVAVEEGAVALDEPAGRPGATVRHLLAHTAGYAFDHDHLLAEPGARRTYSNVGIEVFAAHLADRTGIAFPDYLQQAVFTPLGMVDTALTGSPAHAVVSTVDDLLRFARELLRPQLISAATMAEATSVQFPEVAGLVPGVGRFDPNPWGLTFEIKGEKSPHWTGSRNSPRTFGHFGASGTFLWADPAYQLACVVLTDRDFGPWAKEAWPAFSDVVIDHTVGNAAPAA